MILTQLLPPAIVALLLWGIISITMEWASGDHPIIFSLGALALVATSLVATTVIVLGLDPTYMSTSTPGKALLFVVGVGIMWFVQLSGAFFLGAVASDVQLSKPTLSRPSLSVSRPRFSAFQVGKWAFTGGRHRDDDDDS